MPAKVRRWVEIPYLRLVNPLNVRQHWCDVWKRGQKEKTLTLAAFYSGMPYRDLSVLQGCKRWVVRITRRGPVIMDDDGNTASAKYIRDGVAHVLNVDDGNTKRIRFKYADEKTTKAEGYSVLIEVQGF